jgi:hypothetical protein
MNLAREVKVPALSTGAELVVPPKEVCDDGDLQLEGAAHLRVLDAIDPSYWM